MVNIKPSNFHIVRCFPRPTLDLCQNDGLLCSLAVACLSCFMLSNTNGRKSFFPFSEFPHPRLNRERPNVLVFNRPASIRSKPNEFYEVVDATIGVTVITRIGFFSHVYAP